MSKISQIQIRYVQEEDRLLLRLNTSNKEEFRFWLTRRYTEAVQPLLQQAIHETPTVKGQQSSSNKKAVMDFERKAIEENINFKASFKEKAQSYPLGEQPLLLSQARLKLSQEESYILSLKGVNDKGIDFILDKRLLYIINKVINDSLQQTEWKLDLSRAQISPLKPIVNNKILH
ncbi:MAG: hypothetical protein KAH22_04080 [Thiotrichaceae bacterium]|nr:hypothetical protein [Thiotrichaceae bacterium]